MTAERADRIATGIAYVFIGLSFVVGFLALVDYAADGNVVPYIGGVWDEVPNLAKLVIVCLGAGVFVMFGFGWWMVRTAVDIDPQDKELNDLFDRWGRR